MKNLFLSLLLTLVFICDSGLYATQLDCKNQILPKLSQKERRDLSKDPLALLTSEEALAKRGAVYDRWDEDLGTRIYSTIAEPLKDGSVPLVDKNAKGVVIFFHGSGTAKASGKNFKDTQNILRPFGIAGVSLDLPFHGENKGSEALKNMDNFMEWIHKFVQKVKKDADRTGKKIPIYMMGHSFGPSVIQEYVERYPNDIADFLLMSPAGDFHPALKYTYEKITTPGEKFMGGEPVIPNEAGGEWAGQLDGQFTWDKKKPFDRVPGRMLIGEQDEWWPGNKELAQKVGIAQPYEFKEPLEAYQKKYPRMRITTIPDVGHMLFEAKTKDGKNIVRESILDLVGIPEKNRNPEGVSLSPGEKVALLYQTSPTFKEWLGDRYSHSFRDPERAARVLKDWENQKLTAWKTVLERLPQENPEFFNARGYSWAIAVKEAQRTEPSINGAAAKLRQDLTSYLSADPKQKAELLAKPDPESPKPLKVQSAILEKGWAATTKGTTGPLLREAFEKEIQKRGATNVTSESIGHKLLKIRYEIGGKTYESNVLDYSTEELHQKVNELYVRAHLDNNYLSPGDTVEILDGGLKWKFMSKDRVNITSLQVSQ